MWPCNNLTQKYCRTYCQLQLFSSIFIRKHVASTVIFVWVFLIFFLFKKNVDGIREALQVLFTVSLPDGYVRFIKGKCSVWRGRLKGLKRSPNSANLAICEPRTRGDSHPFLSLIFSSDSPADSFARQRWSPPGSCDVTCRSCFSANDRGGGSVSAPPFRGWRAGTADTCNFKREMNTHFSVGANKA